MPDRTDDPLENDDLLTRFADTGEDQLRVYEPTERVVVVGAGRSEVLDVKLAAASSAGVPVRKRRGGGGTVLLTPGQTVVALVTEVEHPYRNREYARRINEWIATALARLGVGAIEHRGISDLAVGERKITGASIFRRRRILFYQASLLVENDVAEFERFLRMPQVVPDYRSGRSHRAFCTTLREVGFAGTVREVCDELEADLGDRLAGLS